jgi:ribulose-5-phosphate 4-epimerase/fuculose-1-phosphate aldolase
MHEGVANHFSLAVNEDGTEFLINPKKHFSRIRASDLWVIDANDPDSAKGGRPRPDRMGPARQPPSPRPPRALRDACAFHLCDGPRLPSPTAACLRSTSPRPCSTTARSSTTDYGGLALEEEGTRCARLFQDPSIRTMIMGNHGVLFIGETVAETFTRMYYFERAARTYILALQTQQPLAGTVAGDRGKDRAADRKAIGRPKPTCSTACALCSTRKNPTTPPERRPVLHPGRKLRGRPQAGGRAPFPRASARRKAHAEGVPSDRSNGPRPSSGRSADTRAPARSFPRVPICAPACRGSGPASSPAPRTARDSRPSTRRGTVARRARPSRS